VTSQNLMEEVVTDAPEGTSDGSPGVQDVWDLVVVVNFLAVVERENL